MWTFRVDYVTQNNCSPYLRKFSATLRVFSTIVPNYAIDVKRQLTLAYSLTALCKES